MMPWQLEVAQRWISEDFSALPVWGVSSGRCNCGKPCERDAGKHPIGYLAPNGLNDATRDLDLVEHWVAREPNMNLGLVPGPTRFVADIDGELALEELEMLGCVEEVLDTLQVQSSGPDRVHIVLGKGPSDPVPPSAKKLGAHIDIRGPGSYIVAEGSTHISGARYRIIADQLIKQAPRWLLDHLAALSRNGTTKAHDNGGSADGIELRAFVAAGLDF